MKLHFLYAVLLLPLLSTVGMAEKPEKLTCTDSTNSSCVAAAKLHNSIIQGNSEKLKNNPITTELATLVSDSNKLSSALAVALSIPIPPENKPSSEKAAVPLSNTVANKGK